MGIFRNTDHFNGVKPLSEDSLRRFRGLGPLFHFLKFHSLDAVVIDDDFTSWALDTTNRWSIATGATATAFAKNVQAGGFIRGVGGTTAATSGLQLITQKFWQGDKNCGFLVGFKASKITEIRLEAGFTDVVPSVNTTLVNNLSTPTYNSSIADAALIVYDDASSTKTSGLYTIGTSITAAKVANSDVRPTAATMMWWGMQCIGDFAHIYVNGQRVASRGTTQSVEGGNLMSWVFSAKLSDTNSVNLDIDRVIIWQER